MHRGQHSGGHLWHLRDIGSNCPASSHATCLGSATVFGVLLGMAPTASAARWLPPGRGQWAGRRAFGDLLSAQPVLRRPELIVGPTSPEDGRSGQLDLAFRGQLGVEAALCECPAALATGVRWRRKRSDAEDGDRRPARSCAGTSRSGLLLGLPDGSRRPARARRARGGSRGWARATTGSGPGRASRCAQRVQPAVVAGPGIRVGLDRVVGGRAPARPARAQASDDEGCVGGHLLSAAAVPPAEPRRCGQRAVDGQARVGAGPPQQVCRAPRHRGRPRCSRVGARRRAGSRRPRRRGRPCRPRRPCPRRAGRRPSCCRPRRRP